MGIMGFEPILAALEAEVLPGYTIPPLLNKINDLFLLEMLLPLPKVALTIRFYTVFIYSPFNGFVIASSKAVLIRHKL